jgi:uncharacterized protein (TIGR03435 family)
MWQNLLAERFHLILYHETRDFPAYDLAVAPGGPKLKEWTPDPNVDSAAAGPGGRDEQGFPRLRPGLPGSATSFAVRRDGMPSMIRETHRQSMAEFAKGLGASLNRANAQPIGAATPRVTDKTGLTGVYEFRLEFEGTVALPGPPAPALFPGDAAPVAGDPGEGGLSLFTALQKQLGLKLVKAKSVPVDVLVIDHADRTPTEN